MAAFLTLDQRKLLIKSLPASVQKRIAGWSRIDDDRSVANEAASDAHWETGNRIREKIAEAQRNVAHYAREFERGLAAPAGRLRTDARGPTVTADDTSLLEEERERLSSHLHRVGHLFIKCLSPLTFYMGKPWPPLWPPLHVGHLCTSDTEKAKPHRGGQRGGHGLDKQNYIYINDLLKRGPSLRWQWKSGF